MPHMWPAVKGTQKATEYYLTNLTFSSIESLVKLPEEEPAASLLVDDEPMQRRISWGRVRKEMKDYLLEVPDSFYSSLTLFMLPRDLRPAVAGEDYDFEPNEAMERRPLLGGGEETSAMGMLYVDDSVMLFPGDGQHRAASIKEALRGAPELAHTVVPVVLVPYRTPEQVRQLFSDLNLNAKPVNRTIGLAFETRDPRAIIGRRVADLVPLFHGRLNLRTNSLPKSSDNVITFNTLVTANDGLLEALYPKDAERKELLVTVRPNRDGEPVDHATVDVVAEPVVAVWQTMIDALPEWQKVLDDNDDTKPGDIRDNYVFAHGIGWQALAMAAAAMIRTCPDSWADMVTETLETIHWSRGNQDWQNVAMVGDRINNTSPGVRATAGYILSQAGFTSNDVEVADLLGALESSRLNPSVQQAALDTMVGVVR